MKSYVAPLLASLLAFAPIQGAHAQESVPTVAEYAYITDFNSGRILLEKAGEEPMKPASMAKIMTTYIAF